MINIGKLASRGAVLAVAVLLAGSTAMRADSIPYPTPYTPVTTNDIITAMSSSALYFYGFNAADNDYVNILDTTQGTQSGFVFVNQTTPEGTMLTLTALAGDNLIVELFNTTTGSYFYSDTGAAPGGTFSCVGAANPSAAPCSATAAAAEEAVDHAYVTPFSGGIPPGGSVSIPMGVFVGMEDLGKTQSGDYDYNDDQFVLTNVTTRPAPEPSSLMLLGTGLIGAAGLIFRRRQQTV